MMRRLRAWAVDELLLAQVIPGFLLCVGWSVMYEVYHEEGSYYTTLLQEILGGEDLFSWFLMSAILMAFPVGLVIDTVREVVVERWWGAPRSRRGRAARPSAFRACLLPLSPVSALEDRVLLYRHAQAALLTPAKTAGNLGLVLLIFLVWFVIKIVRIQGWHIFSLTFLIGTPVVGLGIFGALWARYAAGLAEFQAFATGVTLSERPEISRPPDSAPSLLPAGLETERPQIEPQQRHPE